ncbi:hypothetical protein [Algoriphagus confluentis]|uniref:Uncharacterized protein n=1 Tax=Algoriphagus confluentis TaxID=1697556 RepID=A0ABQ6PVL7_9BACT|nr:hypothetical protein Aconfl_34300 [Algoriphagus confluentis]
MFDKICIKSKDLGDQKIDISFLVDTMLFYGKVIVLAHKEELVTLLRYFGEDFLCELIITGRLDLRLRENILGSMAFPDGRFNIELLERSNESYSKIIYEAHRELNSNSFKNMKFSDHLSKITEPFRYNPEITQQIKEDFQNVELLKKTLPIYILERVPTFELPDNLQIDIDKKGSFEMMDAYSLKSNIDLKKLNAESRKFHGQKHHDFNFSGFLLTLAESKGDIFISSHFESELVTTKLNSDFIDQQFQDLIQRRLKSQENIELFEQYALGDCHTIGAAFVGGIVSKGELLDLFNKADKFRNWLSKVPKDKNLFGEYQKEISKGTFAEKLPTKTVRFMLFEGAGIALDLMGTGGLGTAIATGLSTIDNFLLDKLLQGWKPNQFIDQSLKPLLKNGN